MLNHVAEIIIDGIGCYLLCVFIELLSLILTLN